MELECPYCEKEIDVDGEHLPPNACDSVLYECPHCEGEMKIGWYAEVEVRQTFSQDDYDGSGL